MWTARFRWLFIKPHAAAAATCQFSITFSRQTDLLRHGSKAASGRAREGHRSADHHCQERWEEDRRSGNHHCQEDLLEKDRWEGHHEEEVQ
jgi:hypothetical protein